eukprot:CAMPEP_0170359130 /NCGR_PEP_ID=MMETSP0117_2-20130122/2594_1 /TAXON_ID=400756 /ORGANISM="Durinskia baltica, Strain CSIRO CS-38" /LENGTH=786 /DNA_ID=CAMNT_0010613379 /DNA_START=70 /DNA_END=2430 /DNA_ORIENTATION=-
MNVAFADGLSSPGTTETCATVASTSKRVTRSAKKTPSKGSPRSAKKSPLNKTPLSIKKSSRNTSPRSVKKTPNNKSPQSVKQTPRTSGASPSTEFGYEDAYSPNGDDFFDDVKIRNVSRRQSSKAASFSTVKRSFLAPTSCSTVKQRSKVTCAETPKPKATTYVGIKPATIPVSPHFRARPTTGKETQLTSEELMLQKIEQEKHAEAERAAKAKKLYTVLKSRASRKNSTIPLSATKATPKKEKKFVQPRKIPSRKASSATVPPPSTVKKGPGGLTLVEPFSFATDKRLPSVTESASATVTLTAAEQAQMFMRDSRSHGAPKSAALKLTVGHSPKLRTKKRGQYAASRPKPPTRDEVQQAEMEEISRHPFRALPLDRRIFDSAGELGVPKIPAKPLTEPMEFEFRADKRSSQPRVRGLASSSCTSLSPTKRSTTTFKAKPAPKTTGKIPVTRARTVFKPTVAKSPKFRKTSRASAAPERRQRAAFTPASSAPKPFEPLKITEPKEFKFATNGRSSYHRQQLEKQIAQEQAEAAAARERKAQPMPDFNKLTFQPDMSAHKHAPTETKPFNLRSTLRHADAQSAFQHDVEMMAEQAKASEFHARPVPATNYKPAVSHVEVKPHVPVVPLPVSLESEKRAQKRMAFDQVMGQKMAQLEVMQETIAKQRAEQDKRQLMELRRKSVDEGGLMFKAKPILTKDQFPTKAMVKAPNTTPLSPQLRPRTRSSVNNLANKSFEPAETLSSASVNGSTGLGRPMRMAKTAPKAIAGIDSTPQTKTEQQLAAALNAM